MILIQVLAHTEHRRLDTKEGLMMIAPICYIPTGINDPLVCWASCTAPNIAVANEIIDLLHNTYGLRGYAGQIVPPGAFEFPYQTTLDLKITQILPGFRDDDEFVISLGIENLLNLLDDNEGEIFMVIIPVKYLS